MEKIIDYLAKNIVLNIQNSNSSVWYTTVTEGEQWCTVTPISNELLGIEISENTTSEDRICKIVITNDCGSSYDITYIQKPSKNSILTFKSINAETLLFDGSKYNFKNNVVILNNVDNGTYDYTFSAKPKYVLDNVQDLFGEYDTLEFTTNITGGTTTFDFFSSSVTFNQSIEIKKDLNENIDNNIILSTNESSDIVTIDGKKIIFTNINESTTQDRTIVVSAQTGNLVKEFNVTQGKRPLSENTLTINTNGTKIEFDGVSSSITNNPIRYYNVAEGEHTCYITKESEYSISFNDDNIEIDHNKTRAKLEINSIESAYTPYNGKINMPKEDHEENIQLTCVEKPKEYKIEIISGETIAYLDGDNVIFYEENNTRLDKEVVVRCYIDGTDENDIATIIQTCAPPPDSVELTVYTNYNQPIYIKTDSSDWEKYNVDEWDGKYFWTSSFTYGTNVDTKVKDFDGPPSISEEFVANKYNLEVDKNEIRWSNDDEKAVEIKVTSEKSDIYNQTTTTNKYKGAKEENIVLTSDTSVTLNYETTSVSDIKQIEKNIQPTTANLEISNEKFSLSTSSVTGNETFTVTPPSATSEVQEGTITISCGTEIKEIKTVELVKQAALTVTSCTLVTTNPTIVYDNIAYSGGSQTPTTTESVEWKLFYSDGSTRTTATTHGDYSVSDTQTGYNSFTASTGNISASANSGNRRKIGAVSTTYQSPYPNLAENKTINIDVYQDENDKPIEYIYKLYIYGHSEVDTLISTGKTSATFNIEFDANEKLSDGYAICSLFKTTDATDWTEDYENWTYTTNGSYWISANTSIRPDGYVILELSLDANTSTSPRTGEINVSYHGLVYTLSITQKGKPNKKDIKLRMYIHTLDGSTPNMSFEGLPSSDGKTVLVDYLVRQDFVIEQNGENVKTYYHNYGVVEKNSPFTKVDIKSDVVTIMTNVCYAAVSLDEEEKEKYFDLTVAPNDVITFKITGSNVIGSTFLNYPTTLNDTVINKNATFNGKQIYENNLMGTQVYERSITIPSTIEDNDIIYVRLGFTRRLTNDVMCRATYENNVLHVTTLGGSYHETSCLEIDNMGFE